MDEQGIPLQEEADGRIGVLEGPVHRIIRRLLIPAVSLPVIDGSGHIAQGGEIPAPFDQRRIAFVTIQESAPREGHEQRTRNLTAVLGKVQVHGQIHPVPFLLPAVPEDAAIDDILRLPHLVHRLPVEFPGREKPEFRGFIRL